MFVCTTKGIEAWLMHVRGASRVLQLGGAESITKEQSPLQMSLLSRVRTATVSGAKPRSFASGVLSADVTSSCGTVSCTAARRTSPNLSGVAFRTVTATG